VERKNKEFLKLLAKTNQVEKEILEKQQESEKKKNEKQKTSLERQKRTH